MRFMVIVKASKDSEAGVMPSTELFAAMGKFNEELVKAGMMEAGEGLHPSSRGARVKYQGGQGANESHQPAIRRDRAVQSGRRCGVGGVRASSGQSHVDHLVQVHAVRLSGRLALHDFPSIHRKERLEYRVDEQQHREPRRNLRMPRYQKNG